MNIDKIGWIKPSDYGFTSERDLKDTGFKDIMELLEIYDAEELLTASSEESLDIDRICGDIFAEWKEKNKIESSTLFGKNGCYVVVSYYDGGLSVVSFRKQDLKKVEKQLLKMYNVNNKNNHYGRS